MKYYVVSDVHGFFSKMQQSLKSAGYFDDETPHKLIICGDFFDRGSEALEMQSFLLELMAKDAVILIRGNHEDLFEDLVLKDHGTPYSHHLSNGTYDTALQLTGFDRPTAIYSRNAFIEAAFKTPYYRDIIPSAQNYFETAHYIFVHGWIPTIAGGSFSHEQPKYLYNWRTADRDDWYRARWTNGIDASRFVTEEGKTIVCGHWHCSYGHSAIEGKGSEFGNDADFSPYYAKGIIDIDGCTAHSGIVNCLVVEDDD